MTIEEFKQSLQPEILEKVKAVCEKKENLTEADAKTLYDFFIEVAAPALGEDQVAEPFRYIISAVNGLRTSDLKALIGEDFNEEIFEELRTALGFELFVIRNIGPEIKLFDFNFPPIRAMLQKLVGEGSYKACASDIGYHLLQNYDASDPVRGIQTMHLLLDGDEAAAAAEYISEAEGEPLRLAALTMGNGLKDGPEYVQQCIYDLPYVQSEKVNLRKILLLLLNDCVAIVNDPQRQAEVVDHLHAVVAGLIQNGEQDVTVLLGVAKLRIAQNARILAQQAHQQKKDEESKMHEQQAQQMFISALNYLMPPLQQADPMSISDEQIRQYWLCLKICQEMAQPKAISLIFEAIVKVEQAQINALAQKQAENEAEMTEEDGQRAEELGIRIIDQHIDMSKLYYQLPQQLQEQFTNYSDATLALIKAYLEGIKSNAEADEENDMRLELRLCNYYQTIGELQNHLGRDDESYEAYTEAQIRQMRHLAAIKHQDEEIAEKENKPGFMSQEGLITRLTLSVTNHMLGMYYRKQNKAQHDLSILLRSNMDLAQDCFKAFPRDGRVVHFIINAALELGDLQHKSKGLMAECGTYEKVIRQFGVLNNMRLDAQLIADIAMIHTKCGQVQCEDSIRRFGDAQRNLSMALNLWNNLAQNTGNPEFKKNAESVQNLLNQIKK